MLIQGHHQNGDKAAEQPYVFCPISGRRFEDTKKAERYDRGINSQPDKKMPTNYGRPQMCSQMF